MRKYSTPGEPNIHIVSPKNYDEYLSKTQQNKYQSAVGSLMYLCKHSRPYLTNNVRDLSRCMKMANKENYEALMRTVKYVLDKEDIGLKLGPIKGDIGEFNLECFSDSDWGGNEDNRKSISGWAIYVCGSLISWGSKAQQSVATSSSMAEYIAISEICKEIMFIRSSCEFLGVKIDLPIIVNVDNMGEIFMSENDGLKKSRHIDIRYHFIREFVDNGIVKIMFVKSENNKADPFTKNLNKESLDRKLSSSLKSKGN